MEEMSPCPPFVPGRYRHYTGKEYEALFLAENSESAGHYLVIYRALYGEGRLWARPLEMWNEWVEVGRERVRRFTYLGEAKGEASAQ